MTRNTPTRQVPPSAPARRGRQGESRTGDEITHGAGREDLTRPGEVLHARPGDRGCPRACHRQPRIRRYAPRRGSRVRAAARRRGPHSEARGPEYRSCLAVFRRSALKADVMSVQLRRREASVPGTSAWLMDPTAAPLHSAASGLWVHSKTSSSFPGSDDPDFLTRRSLENLKQRSHGTGSTSCWQPSCLGTGYGRRLHVCSKDPSPGVR